MTVTLPKGGNVLLSDQAPGIEQVRVCLGWNDGPGSADVEVDGVVIVGDGTPAGSRILLAQQVPNPAERASSPPPPRPLIGDAEKLVVTLAAVPSEVSRLQFGAAIYDAAARRQTFRSVPRAYIRVMNHADSVEIARYTLEVETGQEKAMIFGELYRNPKGWKFRAVGQGYATGLAGFGGAHDLAIAHTGDVADYLSRTSRARSRRHVADQLHPPRAVPPPAAPVPPPSRPAPPTRVVPPSRVVPPTVQRPVPARAPVQPARPATPVPSRSPLDLGDPYENMPSGARATAVRDPARPSSALNERSSRYRQRMEHVSALDADHPVTTWTAEKLGTGAMTVTLRWEPLTTRTGLPRPSDIHFGCLWQSGDGQAGVLQDLADAVSAPGRGASRQVLRLGSRNETEGQTIFVDTVGLPRFKRFFVFAYGLRSVPEWDALRPVLTVEARTGEHLAMRLSDPSPGARICVGASFHMVDGDVIIRRENDFIDGTQADAAARYGWSLEWNPDRMTLRDTR